MLVSLTYKIQVCSGLPNQEDKYSGDYIFDFGLEALRYPGLLNTENFHLIWSYIPENTHWE